MQNFVAYATKFCMAADVLHVRLASKITPCHSGRMESNAATPATSSQRGCGCSSSRCWPWLWVVVAVFLIGVAIGFDSLLLEWVLSMKWTPLASIAKRLSQSAEGQWAALASLGVLLAARLRQRADWKRAGLILLIASSLSGLSVVAIKPFIGRARPNNAIEQGWFGPYHNGMWHFAKSKYNSFPSGHTATAAGFAFAVLVVSRRWGWIFVAWAVGVAWSRMYLNCHFFSDTLASMFICIFWAWRTRRWVDERVGIKTVS